MSPPITQDSLNRLEENARRREEKFLGDIDRRFAEVDRRLLELNNSHERALQERARTDLAATQAQERTVTRVEFQLWKESVEKTLNTQAGIAIARSAMISAAIAVAAIVVKIVVLGS